MAENEEAYLADVYLVYYRCPVCKNKERDNYQVGFMLQISSKIQTNHKKGIPHKCNNPECNHIRYLQKPYPYEIAKIHEDEPKKES